MTFAFHPEARAEFREAALWYEEQRPGLGERFHRAVRRTVDTIVADPLCGFFLSAKACAWNANRKKP